MVAPPRTRTTRTRVRISKSGQITLPAHIRRKLGVEVGAQVDFVEERDGVITLRKPRSATELAGIAGRPADGISVSDLIAEVDRTPIVRAQYRQDGTDAGID